MKHFSIGDFDGYIIVGRYPTGRPGELFVKFAKEGSTLSGLIDAFAIVFSLALQYGVPLKVLCEKLAYTRYEPAGWTGEDDEKGGIAHASSITDYIARWMAKRFLGASPSAPARPFISLNPPPPEQSPKRDAEKPKNAGDGSPCQICGTLCQRTGKCETCPSCGWNSGCG